MVFEKEIVPLRSSFSKEDPSRFGLIDPRKSLVIEADTPIKSIYAK